MKTRRFKTIASFSVASVSVLFSSFTLTAQAQAPKPTPVATMAPIKPPAVQVPSVLPPKAPVMPSTNPVAITPPPAASTTSAATNAVAGPRAALITTAYSEPAYQKASAAGPTLLIFSGAQDAVWAKQTTALQTVLREAEFRAIPSFQIDVADEALMQKFQVTLAGTLLIMKDGVERIRSTRMTNADVIRKMLRLHSAL